MSPRPTFRRAVFCGARIAALALGAATPAAAQHRWQIDVSGTGVQYDTTARIASASVSPLLEWSRGRTYATLGGSWSSFDNADWAFQGRGDGSLLLGSGAGGLQVELAGSAGGSFHSSGYRTAATRAELRFHLGGATAGLWVGGAGASGWTLGAPGIATGTGPTAGAWFRHEGWQVTGTTAALRISEHWFPEAGGRLTGAIGRLDLMAYGGWRGAPTGSGIARATWGGATAAWWIGSRTALAVGAGSYPSDLLQALPRGKYVTVGIRLTPQRPSLWSAPPAARPVYALQRGPSELSLAVPGARRVEVVGDWTAWQPVPMSRGPDGRWRLRVALSPGVYRFNLIVDGVRWITPDGVAALDDGFGGKTSLLVVP